MKGGIMYEQRDIVLVPFPYSDLTGAKLRPALILSNSLINRTDDRICCLITSNPTKEGIIVEKTDFYSGRLPFKSWVKPHRIFTINQKIIKKKLCTMSEKFHERVLVELNNFLRKE
ncbi:MAG: type II toxin-antitoxin system PemK/MazF family toxin [Nanoarchaeota archaeon]